MTIQQTITAEIIRLSKVSKDTLDYFNASHKIEALRWALHELEKIHYGTSRRYCIEWFTPFEQWIVLESTNTFEEAQKAVGQLDLIRDLSSNLRIVELEK